MKTFNVIDLIFQSMLFLVALFSLGAIIAGLAEYFLLLLAAQFITGVGQIGSAVIHLVGSPPHKRLRIFHLTLSAVLVVVVFMGISIHTFEDAAVQITNAISWLLAVLYYILSWKIVFPPKVSGSGFLPHLSF
jgi:hypothetical protein